MREGITTQRRGVGFNGLFTRDLDIFTGLTGKKKCEMLVIRRAM